MKRGPTSSQHAWNCNVSVCYDLQVHATLSSSCNSSVKLKVHLALHRSGQALEGCKSFRLPQLPRKSAHEGGKVSSSTYRPPLSPRDISANYYYDRETSLYWNNIPYYELEYIWVWGSETRINEATQYAKQVKTSWLKTEFNGWLICQNYLQKFDHLIWVIPLSFIIERSLFSVYKYNINLSSVNDNYFLS